MARIAFAWELGGSIGHLLSCAGLARALHARGHSIGLFVRELRSLPLVPEAAGYDVFQAPVSPREGAGAPHPVSYAEILLGTSWRDARELGALLRGWRALLGAWKTDLVVADFAPTALLAARSLGVRRVTYGNGFFNPPALSPLPPFRVDAPVDAARVAATDAAALAHANAALEALGAPRIARLCDAFAGDEDFLCTFPELDHYATRPPSVYWGPRLRTDLGNPMDWPEGPGKRVLVYVQRAMPQLDALIDALAGGPHTVVAYIPGLDAARRARLAGRTRIVIDRPIRLDLALSRCDLLVCHGGEIAGGALACGVPVLLFPQHYEQYLTARRLEQVGAGGWIPHGANAQSVHVGVDAMTRDARYLAAARAFARRYPAWSPMEQRRRVLTRIEQVLARPPASPILASVPRESA